MSVRPAKTQISLGIRTVWSVSSLCAQWVAKDPSFLHVESEDPDQTGRMPRLISVFTGRTVTLLVLSCRGSNDSCHQGQCVFYGVESWSGVLVWSRPIGVEWTRIMEWQMDWSCQDGQQNHTRTLTRSLSFDLPICFITFYYENSLKICHSKIWLQSNTPLQNLFDMIGCNQTYAITHSLLT